MKVTLYNSQKALKVKPKNLSALVRFFLELKKIDCDEVIIHFIDKKKSASLHKKFFNDPTPTDCMTFPMDDTEDLGYKILGEIFVCPEVAIEYCQNKDLDPYEEMERYIIHGLLHLLGYDDIKSEDRKKMRREETKALKQIAAGGLSLKA